jgi:hypothetical protein
MLYGRLHTTSYGWLHTTSYETINTLHHHFDMQRNCETWKQSIVFGEIIFSLVPFILSLPVDMYVKLAGAGAAARRARALASCVVSSDCHASYDIWLRVFTPTDCHASYGMASYVAPMFISSNWQ